MVGLPRTVPSGRLSPGARASPHCIADGGQLMPRRPHLTYSETILPPLKTSFAQESNRCKFYALIGRPFQSVSSL